MKGERMRAMDRVDVLWWQAWDLLWASIGRHCVEKALAQRVLWALKFLKTPGGGGMVPLSEPGEEAFEVKPWEEWFMDALDAFGYHIDRAKFWDAKDNPKKRKKARRAA